MHAAPLRGFRVERARLKTYIRGFDEAIGGGLPEGYVVLLSGAPGTMKSSLAFSILYQNALREGKRGAYFTLEQSKDLLLEQMASMGMTDPKALSCVVLMDMGNIRKNLSYLQGRGTWLELFKMYCNNLMKTERLACLVVDSLDVLETMAKMPDRRAELYFLVEWLRDLGPLTLLVSEQPLGAGNGRGSDEAYLVDGILELEMHASSPAAVQRRLRVAKLRATKHTIGSFPLSCDDDGFSVASPLSGPD